MAFLNVQSMSPNVPLIRNRIPTCTSLLGTKYSEKPERQGHERGGRMGGGGLTL